MTTSNRIEGIVTLTSPLHCASMDESLIKDQNAKSTGTPTVQRRIMTRNGIQKIPYFPGNDLRGRLRRKAAGIVLDRIAADGKVKVELYQGLNCASISGQPDDAALTVEEVMRARDNVYMGLFGGGARLLRSRFRMNDLTPILADTVEIGSVPKELAETNDSTYMPLGYGDTAAKGYQILDFYQCIRIDDVMRVARLAEMEKYIEDYQAAILGKQLSSIEERVIRKEQKEQAKTGEIKKEEISKKTKLDNIMSVQTVISGTPMYFLMDLNDDASDAHVGLMLMSLRELVREQALGGWIRAGMGRFDANLYLTRNGSTFPVFADKNARQDAELSEAALKYAAIAIESLQNVTASDLMEFFAPQSESAVSVARKAKKAEKQAETSAVVQ